MAFVFDVLVEVILGAGLPAGSRPARYAAAAILAALAALIVAIVAASAS